MKPRRANSNQSADSKILTVKIERIVPDGFGIGFAENLTVFVSLAAPGDVLKVRVDRRKGSVAFASIIEVLEPSEARSEPPCPYFGRCGGCDFQHLNYQAQLTAKVEIIKDCLRRIAKIDWHNEIEIIASPEDFGYRTRAQWKREGSKIGYYERNSHRVIDVETCPILAEPLQQELARSRARLKSEKLDCAEIQTVSSGEIVSWREGGEHSFDENFYAANKELSEESRSETRARNVSAREVKFNSGDFTYQFSAATFFQVNHFLLPQFVATALENARGNLALDLFCGVGLFALPLAKNFKKVIGVEGNQTSIEFAQKNAARAKLENAYFEVGLVGKWLAGNIGKLLPVDFVLLDPPRTGAEKETIESLIALRPNQIVYVSCNPATLARDLRLLCANDFVIEKITAFDFFPQTHHVETVVRLKLREQQ